nr:hypothetical protein CFP56_41401 [Quercus suber]
MIMAVDNLTLSYIVLVRSEKGADDLTTWNPKRYSTINVAGSLDHHASVLNGSTGPKATELLCIASQGPAPRNHLAQSPLSFHNPSAMVMQLDVAILTTFGGMTPHISPWKDVTVLGISHDRERLRDLWRDSEQLL